MEYVFTEETADDLWLSAREVFLGAEPMEFRGRTGRTREVRPVLLSLRSPQERWVVSRTPVLNPAAVLAEVVWIVSGRRNSSFVNYWNPALPEFAGEGEVYHGAYGYRLRHAFGIDQVETARKALSANPESRQVCLAIWHPRTDQPTDEGKPQAEDIPCNVCAMLKVRDGKLEWTQVMRSNDLWLGLPFNIVQFTMLQEFMAGWLGIGVGTYHHLSDSLHLYERDESALRELDPVADIPRNSDDLTKTPFLESERLLRSIEARMELMSKGDLPLSCYEELLPPEDWPTSYANFFRVILADAARRSEHTAFALNTMTECTNDVLKVLYARWHTRQQNDKEAK